VIPLENILQSIKHLPPVPTVIQKALSLLMNQEVSASKIVEVIQYDQALTANVLKICNSAYFGLSRKIYSLQEALVRIGNRNMRIVIMASSLMQFYKKAGDGYDLRKGDLWRHSVACGMMSMILGKTISQRTGHAVEDHYLFTTALLHDLGKVVLNEYVKESFEEIVTMVESRKCSFVEAEREIIGMDHAALGARISRMWKFPDRMAEAIAYHHEPESSPEPCSLLYIVHLSDLLCMMMGIGGGVDGLAYRGMDSVLQTYGLAEKDVERCMASLLEEMARVDGFLYDENDVHRNHP